MVDSGGGGREGGEVGGVCVCGGGGGGVSPLNWFCSSVNEYRAFVFSPIFCLFVCCCCLV